MALKENYKDDILDVSVNTKRKYRMTENPDGTISLEDETVYTQQGDSFGASDMNATNGKVNTLESDIGEINDNLSGFKFYPTGTQLVAYIEGHGWYNTDGKYVIWGTATANALVEASPNTYYGRPSEEDLRGEVGADTAIPFKSKTKIKIPNIQLYGSDSGSGTRDAIADTEIDTLEYTNLKIGTLTMVNSSSYQEYIMVLGDGTPIWSKSLDNGSYSANDIVVDISSVNKLKIRLKIANLNANCYVYAQNIEIS